MTENLSQTTEELKLEYSPGDTMKVPSRGLDGKKAVRSRFHYFIFFLLWVSSFFLSTIYFASVAGSSLSLFRF